MKDDIVSQKVSIGEQSEDVPKPSTKKSSKKKGGKRTGKKSAPSKSKNSPEPQNDTLSQPK